MKSKDFASFAADFAAVLSDNGATEGAEAWREFASIFSIKSSAKVSDVCCLFGVTPPTHASGARIEQIVQSIPSLLQFLGSRAKKDILVDLQLIANVLAPIRQHSLSDFVQDISKKLSIPAARTSPSKEKAVADAAVVQRHFDALEQSKWDESAFKLAYASLSSDAAVKTSEAKLIAKMFSGESAKSKKDALKFILGHHNSLIVSRAKNAATGGRTAA